ncbi:FeoA family protein [Aliamphritea hakodatensis]|uniref:FeoA family protein n=1 Tax=Aliamphritea hakodatensis TaxID=2895352 RepID=UPI0022FD6862|nr:FeoA family protein [Aliamphritea hakodatensis]
MTLDQLPQHTPAQITGFTGDQQNAYPLSVLGVTPGATVIHLNTAPLGDPIQVRVSNTYLSIRKQDASQIRVTIL